MALEAGYKLTDEAGEKVRLVLQKAILTDRFDNARGVRNMFEQNQVNQADRLDAIKNPSREQLVTLQASDISFSP
jgi:AAA lid domain